MRKFLWLVILVLQLGLVHAHWDDQFDEKTGLVTTVRHDYEDASRNTVEARNLFRHKGKIETDRIHFIPLAPTHKNLFFTDLFAQETVMKHYELGKPRELEYVEGRCIKWVDRWDESPFSWWALFDKGSNKFIGGVGAFFHQKLSSIEIAYLLTPSAEKQGYMTEALQKGFIPYAKQAIQEHALTCTTIHAPIDPENQRSIKLVDKIGMKHDREKDYFSESYNRPRHWYALDLGSV